MPEPTRCPTCGHPVTIPDGGRAHWSGVPQDYATQAIPPEYRPTAPDPASVAAMRELLTVELAKVRVDDDLSYVDYGDFAEWWEKVRALLGPAATEGGG